ncbi:UvrD-helicase domain-containing protein [Dokdonella ginsengisoli]|uniref:RecBCD enzyme subunit RecB n=1 Tax=Dokdonella ginsengisoli TaxID=363846 RepID=A0ABV9QYM6_9GAMM
MSSAAKHANWRALALLPGGRSLIEASAGTGKTWTISVLYLRLLLEQGLSPKRIVVTTFTDAAAQELRERIRERLLWAERLADGRAVENADPAPDEDWLRRRWSGSADATRGARADLHRLRLALAELDLAPIGTLHGLCRRILADFPFECGASFDPGELVAGDDLIEDCANDLWRRLFQGEPDAADASGTYLPRSLGELKQALRAALAPGVTVRVPDADALRAGLPPDTLQTLRAFAEQDENYAPTDTGKPNARLKNALGSLLGWLADPAAPISDTHRKTLSEPRAHLKPEACAKPGVGVALELISRVLQIRSELAQAARARSWKAWAEWARADIARRLAVAGQLTFDALIVRVHEALHTNGEALAARLFEAWPVALVDEFQDTDALQYGILDRIYRDADGTPRGRLVMIGDPKQAIYRFRGGDIDAYLAARRSATDAMTLDTNFRSSQALVAALNAFHAQAGEVLSTNPQHEIRYESVQANGRGDAYTIDGVACERPLQIHFLREGDVPESQAARRAAALEACANQIVDLLSGGHAIGRRPLRPGDVAVLLPSHGDIADLRARLQARDVPCVSSSRDDVFRSAWARELQIVLHAALHPRDDGAVRAALATRLGGRSWDELRVLNADPDAWQRESAVFGELDATWRSRGVLAAVRAVIERASARLFARADRERALTDLRHLGELLQAQSDALPGRDLLLAWLADQREGRGGEGEAAEEKQLRIESDAARVALMTLHASKGLEFEVVVLPLMWASSGRPGEIPLLHDPASGRRVIAFGDAAERRHAQEAQDERFRLLYVALTRARQACHVYALSPERPKQRGGRKGVDPERSPLDAMLERLLRDGDPSALPHVAWSEAPWSWPWRHWIATEAAPPAPRTVRREPADAPFEYRYSFSALSHGAYAGALEERAASDEDSAVAPGDDAPLPAEAEHPQLAWLAPVAGPEFGNAVHAMFERRRIGQPMAQQHALIRRALRDERVRLRERSIDELVPHLAARIQAALDAPLLPARDPALTLGGLPAWAQRAEMEFDFLLDEVSLRELRRVCDFVPGSAMQDLHGLMNGKIDLVFEHAGRFHVLDYKTNRLGDGRRLSAYAPQRLEATMTDSHYRFQALLYTVAVDRYLRQRVAGYRRGEHLGEAIYLFVRAVGIAPEAPRAGLWTHRFDEALLDAVDRLFAGRVAAARGTP